MSDESPPPVARRITIGLTPRASAAVDASAAREGLSKSDVVNRAVQLYDLIEAEKEKGKRLALITEDGSVETLTVL